MKSVLPLGLVLGLAACGGPGHLGGGAGSGGKPFASGPISDACLRSDRRARSPVLCGCIQAVANQTLSSADQRRAVTFYSDPHSAQVVRTSDRRADRRFWEVYTAYADRAERVCG